MIIWSGYGFLAGIIILVCSAIVNLITDYVIGDEGFYSSHPILFGVSCLFSALIIKLFSNYFNKKKAQGKGTYVFDRVTIAQGNENKLFFIPFAHWVYVMAVLGLIIIIVQLLLLARG